MADKIVGWEPVRTCPHCGKELNLLEGAGDDEKYATEIAECLNCQKAILIEYTQAEVIIYLSRRLAK